MLLESGLSFTVLQPAAYMQNLRASRKTIVGLGTFQVPYPVTTRLSLVHLDDVGEAAATVLTEPNHEGATYELVGTEPLAQTEVAMIFRKALERPVRAIEVSLDIWQQQATSAGLGAYAVQTLLKMFRYYGAYGLVGNPRVLTWLLGREPTSLSEFARTLAAI